jgi:RNA polymerase sigma-70 factor (ECF subfamily)
MYHCGWLDGIALMAPGLHAGWTLAVPVGITVLNNNNATNAGGDAELFSRIQAGERAAFLELYDRYAGLLLSVATRVLSDRREAEDVVQEVFLQIWRRCGDYDPALGSVAGWAVTLTRNQAIDRLRSRTRRMRLIEEISIEADEAGETAASANELLHGQQRAEAVRGAIRGLPHEQRLAIELAFFAGLTQSEIATRLKEPLGTIKARIRRGMLKLREQLGGVA